MKFVLSDTVAHIFVGTTMCIVPSTVMCIIVMLVEIMGLGDVVRLWVIIVLFYVLIQNIDKLDIVEVDIGCLLASFDVFYVDVA